ncbi:TPA: hypothetical protein QHN47_004401 [Klebsiella aerogenes]|nr:hypothetical protein [Klebsiella aerogenes]HDT5519369.1 hypothetical protein [Klebsiella aerogenes]
MNRSTITRERLEEIILDNSASLEEFMAITRMALAAMDSEPVAWTSEEAIAEVYCDETGMIGPKYMIGDVPLYRHAQPAPVVTHTLADVFIAAIEKEQDRLHGEDYLMDSKDCIDVIREEALRLSASRAVMLQGVK